MHYTTDYLRLGITQLLLAFLCTNFAKNVSGDSETDPGSLELQGVAESGNLFAEDLYEALTKPGSSFEDRNVLISPLSLYIGLAMLRTGSFGLTREEMTRGLRINNETKEEEVETEFKNFIKALKDISDGGDVHIQLANRMFLGHVYPIKSSFLNKIQKYFDADAEQVNFGNGHSAASTINQWVRRETKNKIKEIVTPTTLNNNTVMVLASAIHFKGHWKYPFHPDYTAKKPFTTVTGYSTQVNMMKMDVPRRFQYAKIEEMNASVVALPFSSERFSFIIVLPDPGENLKEVESRIQDGTLSAIPSKLTETWVDVKMPKGILESTIDLVGSKTIKSLGMSSITTRFAEFDNLSDERGVHVTNVIHKAFMEIDEAGMEAAAASLIRTETKAANKPKNVVKFAVDRPFLGYIYDGKTKAVLFIARKLM